MEKTRAKSKGSKSFGLLSLPWRKVMILKQQNTKKQTIYRSKIVKKK